MQNLFIENIHKILMLSSLLMTSHAYINDIQFYKICFLNNLVKYIGV